MSGVLFALGIALFGMAISYWYFGVHRRRQAEIEEGVRSLANMSQVQAKFGTPAQKLAPVAGPNDRKHNPPITRWIYPTFEVYFEYDHVIDAVLIKASPEEIGPAPVRQ